MSLSAGIRPLSDHDWTHGGWDEVMLLSLLLIDATADETLEAVIPRLRSDDFMVAPHGNLYRAILAAHADRQRTTPDVVMRYLSTEEARALGGYVGLNEYVARVDAFVSSADYYVDEILRYAKIRRLTSLGVQMAQSGGLPDDPDEVYAHYLDQMQRLGVKAREEQPRGQDAAFAAMSILDRPIGTPTPWSGFNGIIGGWQPGMLVVLGARPAVGKSVLGAQAALDLARRGSAALVISMEMRYEDLLTRMYCSIAEVDYTHVTHRNLTGEQYRRLSEASSHVASLDLVISDRSRQSLEEIRAQIAAEKRLHPVGLVVVDYLNLIKPSSDRQDRRVQVDEIAQGLKNIAHDEAVPVLALAQLNRSIESRADKMPGLSDLRESGGIEQAADIVILMHRQTNPDLGDPEDLSLWIAKNRFGAQATFHLRFQGEYARALDLPWHGTPLPEVEPDRRYGD